MTNHEEKNKNKKNKKVSYNQNHFRLEINSFRNDDDK